MKNVSLFCPEFGDNNFFRASLVIITRTTTKTTICLHSCGCSSGTSSQEWLFRSGSLQTTIEKQKMLAPGKKSHQKSSQEWWSRIWITMVIQIRFKPQHHRSLHTTQLDMRKAKSISTRKNITKEGKKHLDIQPGMVNQIRLTPSPVTFHTRHAKNEKY